MNFIRGLVSIVLKVLEIGRLSQQDYRNRFVLSVLVYLV